MEAMMVNNKKIFILLVIASLYLSSLLWVTAQGKGALEEEEYEEEDFGKPEPLTDEEKGLTSSEGENEDKISGLQIMTITDGVKEGSGEESKSEKDVLKNTNKQQYKNEKDHEEAEEKVKDLCKEAAQEPEQCLEMIVEKIKNQDWSKSINPKWIVLVAEAQLMSIKSFANDMLKQRPQDQVLLKCKDAYSNQLAQLGQARDKRDLAAYADAVKSVVGTLNKECTSVLDSNPEQTTPEIATKLREAPNKAGLIFELITRFVEKIKNKFDDKIKII